MYGVGLDVEVKRIKMHLVMQMQKKNDGLALRNLRAFFKKCDLNNSGALDIEEFEKALKMYK